MILFLLILLLATLFIWWSVALKIYLQLRQIDDPQVSKLHMCLDRESGKLVVHEVAFSTFYIFLFVFATVLVAWKESL